MNESCEIFENTILQKILLVVSKEITIKINKSIDAINKAEMPKREKAFEKSKLTEFARVVFNEVNSDITLLDEGGNIESLCDYSNAIIATEMEKLGGVMTMNEYIKHLSIREIVLQS